MTLSPKTQALIWRSLVGLALVEIPVVTFQLSQPVFDYKVLAVGLLGALAGFLDKQFSPQLANVILPNTKVGGATAPAVAAQPTLDDLPALVALLKQRRASDDALLAQLAGIAGPVAPTAVTPPGAAGATMTAAP